MKIIFDKEKKSKRAKFQGVAHCSYCGHLFDIKEPQNKLFIDLMTNHKCHKCRRIITEPCHKVVNNKCPFCGGELVKL